MLIGVVGECDINEFDLVYKDFELIKYSNYARLRALPWFEE